MPRVRQSEQVEAFLARQPPAVKKALGEDDIRALENDLAGFFRLRVGRCRVIYCYSSGQVIDCIFAEERRLVYEVFSAMVKDALR